MPDKKPPSFFVTGLAIFSMFFGAGNLLFPLYLGQKAGIFWPVSTFGFFLTAVLAPFFGVYTMVKLNGCTDSFFGRLGKPAALLFIFILTIIWIPIGAAPRCINVAYESFQTLAPSVSEGAFGLCYSLLLLFILRGRKKMLSVMGYVLTPLLLISIFLLWVFGMQKAGPLSEPQAAPLELFFDGLAHGYSTMDLIASFFYASALVHILSKYAISEKETIQHVLKGGVFGMFLLTTVYSGLIFLAASNSATLSSLGKEQLLPFLCTAFLPQAFSFVPVLLTILACLTTSVAMIDVFGEMMQKYLYGRGNKRYYLSVLVPITISYLFSLQGLERVISFTMPALHIACPLLITLAFYHLFTSSRALPQKTSLF